jgi:hypothetical protein
VETNPDGEMRRMRRFPASATYIEPSASTGTAHGKLNEAAAPCPSAKLGLPEPATVVTRPAKVMRRTRCPLWSQTSTVVEIGSTDKPIGVVNHAAVPCPSTHPAVPLPASELTFQ